MLKKSPNFPQKFDAFGACLHYKRTRQDNDPMYFLMTNDVEAHSLSLNREDPGTVDQVHKVGLPRLLDLLSKHDVSSTFYFTGMLAETTNFSLHPASHTVAGADILT